MDLNNVLGLGNNSNSQSPNSSPLNVNPFKKTENNSVQQLLDLANSHGGAVSQAAQELVHPTTSILSTIGNDLKNTFSAFVDTISIPSEAVAGLLSSKYNVSQAIAKHLRPSDVIWGLQGSNQTTMQKVGSFLVRGATDILLDPLTYIGEPIWGIGAVSKITVGENVLTLSKDSGMASLDYLKKVERQSSGLQSAMTLGGDTAKLLPNRLKTFKEIKAIEAGGKIPLEVMTMGKDELHKLLSTTMDSPLNPDFSKQALAKVLTTHPQLTNTLVDKGGFKLVGKTILSAQRIRSVNKLIPGMTWLDNATSQTRLAIGSLFNPAITGFTDAKGGTTFMRIPPEFTDYVRKTENLASALNDKRLLNMRAILKANKIDANMSGQFFMAAAENAYMPADKTLQNAYKQLLGYNENELKYLRSMGIPITRLENHVPHILVDSGAKVLPFKLPPSTKVVAAMHRTLEGSIFQIDKAQMPAWEKAVLTGNKSIISDTIAQTKRDGFNIFEDNFFKASIARSMNNVRAGTMKQFIDALAGKFASKADEAPAGWVGINVGKYKAENEYLARVGMEASQLKFHPAIAKKIENFTTSVYGDVGTQNLLKSYDSLLSSWKASVTSIFPAFHGRNAISNVFLNFNDIGLHSIDPQVNALSSQIIYHDAKLNGLMVDAHKLGTVGDGAKTEISNMLTKKIFTDVHGYDWSFGELRSVIKNNDIALKDNIVGQVDVSLSTEDMINALMPKGFTKGYYKGFVNPLDKNFTPYKWGRKVGNYIEGQARLVNFLTNLRKTGDVSLATARTKQFLFDYNYLTPFEKNFMRRIIPFYSFTRKNLEAQIHTFVTSPGRTAAQLTALTTLGDVIAGQKLTPKQQKALPNWVKDGIDILASKKGQQVTVLGSLGTPIEQPFQYFHANQILSSVSPFIRLPVELGSGFNFFQGKPISDITNAAALKNFPAIIKDYVGYTDVSFIDKHGKKVNMQIALNPERLHLILNMPYSSRVMSAMKQMQSQNVAGQAKLLQQIIGIRPYSFNLDVQEQKKTRAMQQKLENLLSHAGVGYNLTRFIQKKTP